MDFSFSEEQVLLRDAVGGFLRDRYDFDSRRAAIDSETGWRPQVWRAFAEELGILGASVPEALGGLGGGPVETMVIMEELGRALVVEPFLETAVIGAGLLRRLDGGGIMDAMLSGEAVLALAHAEPRGRHAPAHVEAAARRNGSGWVLNGHKAVVEAAPWASHLLVTARTGGAVADPGGVSLFLIEKAAPGVTTQDYPTVDGRRASEIRLDDVAAPADALLGAEGEALPLVEAVLDAATAAVCAEAVGVMRRLHEDTLDYARQRRQFGRPIGDFQVLQHRLVDMFMALEQAVSMTYMATLKLDAAPPERMKAVSAAKVQVGRACRFVGQSAIQIHGGIGMTDELPLSHYFKRATAIEGQFGSADHHLRRYQRLSLAGGVRSRGPKTPPAPELPPSRDQ